MIILFLKDSEATDYSIEVYNTKKAFYSDSEVWDNSENWAALINLTLGKHNFLTVKHYKNEYERKQAALEYLAHEWEYYFNEYQPSCYISQLAAIQNWFYENGKRYGLLADFRENAIC